MFSGRNVWEDIHPDSQDFVKDYLAQYPEVTPLTIIMSLCYLTTTPSAEQKYR